MTLVKPSQPTKTHSPMVVTLRGIVTLVKREQFLNAQSPMVVTHDGIITEVTLNPEIPNYIL